MKFVHRIAFRVSHARRRELELLGVIVPGDGVGFVAFDVDESHPQWVALRELFSEWDVSDLVRTEFSEAEIEAAVWLNLVPNWHHGYPQPNEEVFGFREATYDLAEHCPQCGTGLLQKAPFQMKAEPKWGRNGILQLNWVFDEYFVKPEVWRNFFHPHGIGCREVLGTRGSQLKSVVQLVIEAEVDIVTGGLAAERCSSCGRVKYLPVTRGYFPSLADVPSGHAAKTRRYFGSGGSANRGVLISKELARALRDGEIRGASVKPVAQLGAHCEQAG